MLDTNVYHYFMLHKMFLDRLLERSKKGKKSMLLGTASVIMHRQVTPFTGYAATKGANGYLSFALDYEMKKMSARKDGADPSKIEISCATPFGVTSNLVPWHYKIHIWTNTTSPCPTYCEALEKNIG